MAEKNHYVVAFCDDWEGLFINGELVMQGHSLHIVDFMCHVLERTPTSFAHKEADGDWTAESGCFPDKLDDMKWA